MKINLNILPEDGHVRYFEEAFDTHESGFLFEQLLTQTAWQQQSIRLFGKNVKMPRLTAWYGEEGKRYTYSGLENEPLPWSSVLLRIKAKAEVFAGITFNSVLLNLYRDGNDSMGWHKDDEKELGLNPVIASVSFGATRRFLFRHGVNKELKKEVLLYSGSIFIMEGTTQHHWYHCVPKTRVAVGQRINLTFRQII